MKELVRNNEYCMDSVPRQYLTDASGFSGFADQVFVPSNEAEVLTRLKALSQQGTPVTVAVQDRG